ncbi:hypothetical protein [Roseibium sp.]|uniref:hypothetical protein n=1 Tax=Roseibium sp. TaxID=1936156 RepID=UPI003BA8B4D3
MIEFMQPNTCSERKILFVHNPKAAGTSFRKWLGINNRFNHFFPSTHTPVKIWNDYTVIVVVRDPIERAISGYKYLTHESYQGTFRKIYPDLPSWDPLTFFSRMFNEQIIVVPPQFKYATHFLSNKPPDFLLKFENLDTTELARHLKIKEPFPRENIGKNRSPIELREDLYVALIRHYRVDYLLYDYRPKPYDVFMDEQHGLKQAG